MLKVKLTFDYEIFFSKNHVSNDMVLFKPTQRIMDILDKYNIKATFFVDTLSFFKMKEMSNLLFCNCMEKQCIEMINRGHNPQLHIHAHWLESNYDEDEHKWITNYKKYRIQDYQNEIMYSAVKKSVSFLTDCGKKANNDYCCDTFRAGGLILQPEHPLVELLINNGFKYDSSIAPNTKSSLPFAEYNYLNCPKQGNWKISAFTSCCFDSKNEEDYLIEIPVATVRNNLIRYLFSGSRRIKHPKPKGVGFERPKPKISFLRNVFRRLFGYSWVSLDTRNYKAIISDLKFLYRKYKCSSNDVTIALIGHPKVFSEENFSNLETLVLKLFNNKKIVLEKKE